MKGINLLLVLLIFFKITVFSNVVGFEGIVKILKEGPYDTVWIEILVKGNLVKVNEYDKGNRLQHSYIANLSTGTTYLVSYHNKMFTRLEREKSATTSKSELIKTENFMVLNGVKCYQWRVRNRDLGIETTYWVAQSQYTFLEKIFGILANAGTALDEMARIPEAKGIIPWMVVDRTKFRKIRSSIKIVDIKAAKISANTFNIPKEFSELIPT